MDISVLLEYGWVLIVLIVLEGLLAADNAIVLAVLVKHLNPKQRKKALFYGLVGAFVFRLIAIFLLVWLVQWWFIQAIGAAYLLYVSIAHLIQMKNGESDDKELDATEQKGSGFLMTVFKVELADIAFAVDSILAAAAVAMTLPEVGGEFFGVNVGQYTVMFIGGLIGVIIMRFFASWFVDLIQSKPGLEIAAFIIVGWVGIKLLILTLAHESLEIIPHEFPHSTTWKVIFWSVMIIIVLWGWFTKYNQTHQKSETVEK